jgi:YbbR domain-containing protein
MLDLIVRRWHLKLLALGLAFAVWVAVTGEGRGLSDLRVPVEVLLSDGVTLQGTPPTTVTVRLRGPEPLLRRVDPYDLDVRIDLRNAGSGERTVQLTPRNVSGVPRDLEVAMIDPDRLHVAIARKTRREVPVVPSVVGKPPRGYAVYRALARPDGLEVEGPETKLASATRLRTDPIRVDDRREPFTVRVGAVPETADLKVVDSRPLDVTVDIDIAPVEDTIDRVPVVVAGDGAGAIPTLLSVRVAAPPEVLRRLRAGHIRAVADVAATASGGSRGIPVRIDFPGLDDNERAMISVKSVTPRTVDVRPGTPRSQR